jgi:hypothetical protein
MQEIIGMYGTLHIVYPPIVNRDSGEASRKKRRWGGRSRILENQESNLD